MIPVLSIAAVSPAVALLVSIGTDSLSSLPAWSRAENVRVSGQISSEAAVTGPATSFAQAQFDRMNSSPEPGRAAGEPFARLNGSALAAPDLDIIDVQFVPAARDGTDRIVRSAYSGSAYERSNLAEAVWLVVLRRTGATDAAGVPATVTVEVIIGDVTGEHLSSTVIIDPQE
ncbi:MAG: hypothetical protein KC470_11750 [Dehalococcoidia bacterium]|nr:hypothetical protein [Dehalococcoidia bacterium]